MERKLINLTRQELGNLQWASKAIVKDAYQPVLKGFQIFGKRLFCTDGFRVHSIPLPQEITQTEKTVVYPLTSLGACMGVEENGDKPKGLDALNVTAQQQVFAFAVTGKYLSDALSASKISTIRVFAIGKGQKDGNYMLVVEPVSGDGERLSFVMTAHASDLDAKAYSLVEPTDEPAKEQTTTKE